MCKKQIMYKVNFSLQDSATVQKITIKKVTEKTVLTVNEHRYLKQCQAYELFDSFNIAVICAKNYTKKRIEALEHRLKRSNKNLDKLSKLQEKDLN